MRSVVWLLFSCLVLPAQQASIEGLVVNDLTGEPIAGAHVRLSSLTLDGPRDTYGAMSDPAGRFSITSVHPGTYMQSVDRTGFVEMLTKEKPAPFSRLILKPDQHLTGYKITLTPRAVIRGRVVNQEGDPVEGVEVSAEPASKDSSPFGLSNTLTDDHGEFILGGVPGSYYVKARPSKDQRPLELRSDGTSDVIYSVTYSPNSTSKEHASRVDSRAGREVAGIEIRLSVAPRQPTLKIRGVVTGRPDDGSTTVGILMESGDNPKKLDSIDQAEAQTDGSFTFEGVTPGFHRIYAYAKEGRGTLLSQVQDLQLSDAAPSPLTLALAPGGDLTGSVEIVGEGALKPADRTSVLLQSLGGLSSNSSAAVDKEGAFQMFGVLPGRFTVKLDPLPEEWYIKSVTLDGSSVDDNVADLTHGAHASSLKITVSRYAPQISGKIQDKDGTTLQGFHYVVLLRDNQDSDSESLTQVKQDGHYQFKSIRPGKYRLFAVDPLGDTLVVQDSMHELSAAVKPIEIKEGDRIEKNLVPLQREAADAKQK